MQVAILDIRSSGRYDAAFAGPNGERFGRKVASTDIVPMRRLVFTVSYPEGFVPAKINISSRRRHDHDEFDSAKFEAAMKG